MNGFPYPVPSSLLHAIEESRSVVVATHENPDADGIGSLMAFGLALAERGRDVCRLAEGPLPPALAALPGIDRLREVRAGDAPVDLLVLFDCHRRARLGAAGALVENAVASAAIDHHPRDPRGADVDHLWIVEDAPSTSMMVLSLLHELHDVPLDPVKASHLYAGLLTDTGGFRHANTTHDALLAAADLVHSGAHAEQLAEALLHRRRPEAVRLVGEVLSGTQYRLDGRVAVMVVDQDVLARTGARLDESEQLASQLTGIEGVVFGVLLREVAPGQWRVSLRANGTVAVDAVARSFGGGGHHRAAAFTAEGARDAVEARLVRALAERLDDDGGAS